MHWFWEEATGGKHWLLFKASFITKYVVMQVTSIVACMLEAGSNAIVGHLFGDCDLLGWLLNAPAHCELEQRPGDTRCVPFLQFTLHLEKPPTSRHTYSVSAVWPC